jgi:hypothetical protein
MKIKVNINLPSDYYFPNNLYEIIQNDFTSMLSTITNYKIENNKLFEYDENYCKLLDFTGNIVIKNEVKAIKKHSIEFMIQFINGEVENIYEYRNLSGEL